MTYAVTWLNPQVDAKYARAEGLLSGGERAWRRWVKIPLPLTQAKRDAATAALIAWATAQDAHLDAVAAFLATNADLSLVVGNATDAQTLITRNGLSITVAQIKARFQKRLDDLNAAIMSEIADAVT